MALQGGPLTVSGSNVGWFPLGPHEAYVPGYRVSPAYARNVNITNTTIINNTYVTNVYTNLPANQHYVNNTSAAVTAVPQDVFTSGQRLAGHTQRIPPALLTGAVAGAVAPAIVPSRASVLGPSPPHGIVRPPPARDESSVLARTPLPRAPVPFDRQLSAIEANGGRPLARADLARLQPAAAAVPVRMVAVAPAPHPVRKCPRGHAQQWCCCAGLRRARACTAEQHLPRDAASCALHSPRSAGGGAPAGSYGATGRRDACPAL